MNFIMIMPQMVFYFTLIKSVLRISDVKLFRDYSNNTLSEGGGSTMSPLFASSDSDFNA